MEVSVPTTKNLPWLNSCLSEKAAKEGVSAQVSFVGRGAKLPQALLKNVPAPIKKKLTDKSSMESFENKNQKHWVLQAQVVSSGNHYELFSPSPYAMARDLMGTCFRQISQQPVKSLVVEYVGDSEDELKGLCVGIEMAQYRFKEVWPQSKSKKFKIQIKSSFKNHKVLLQEACALGEGVNIARYLVDLPANALNPKNYVSLLQQHFSKKAKTQVTVWDHKRLEKEKMGLHVAVGQGSRDKSYMVRVQYRGAKTDDKTIAFVGKGITFDSGGLDVKPATGMRLMKKDMGGSACVLGLAHFVVATKVAVNCDFYFALAENAISEDSFRPGDILTARNGKTVEIHNTDAEGRLVLADVMTVASESKPAYLIDVATLTGAIKVGLGSSVPGLFSNNDNLADSLLQAGQLRGDNSWRMPLVPQEKSRLKSDVADMVNCTEGYGGAVTAALFLEHFVNKVPWAHFDIYAWNDRPNGLFAASGGSGQVVQALSHFVSQQV